MGKSVSRRTFLGQAATVAAAPLVLSACVTAEDRRVGANDIINVGFIGCGRRGSQLMGLPEGARIVAFSDVYTKRLTAMQEKFPGTQVFQDYREMLEMDGLDAVVVATPDHWHCINAVHACQAGKDVYIEKPMSLTVAEGRALVKAARRHGSVVQVGSQQRSSAKNRQACELIRNGALGKVHTVHGANYPSPWECDLPEEPLPEGLDWDMWCGQTTPRPYHQDLFMPRGQGHRDAKGRILGWISFRPYSGGEMTGWGAHGLDMIQWALGTELSGPVVVWPEGEGLTCPVTFRYADGTLLKLDGKGGQGGGYFIGDEGEMKMDRDKFEVKPAGIATADLGPDAVRLYKSDNHMANWLECIRSRKKPVADVEIGHRSTTMCHLGNIARWAGRRLQWDPDRERFVNDEDANGYLKREMRTPWVI